jgi:hypothetical protein
MKDKTGVTDDNYDDQKFRLSASGRSAFNCVQIFPSENTDPTGSFQRSEVD